MTLQALDGTLDFLTPVRHWCSECFKPSGVLPHLGFGPATSRPVTHSLPLAAPWEDPCVPDGYHTPLWGASPERPSQPEASHSWGGGCWEQRGRSTTRRPEDKASAAPASAHPARMEATETERCAQR